ncbi:capsule biosynthesis protein CapC [Pantoea rodasii]|uniref:Capsule biosynthesis protein CapC n=1 Tax=Pantoea rodasii TaxID=1076549 RepID=A0A2M9W8K5_9GAMM|nr:capsule biosynthesis protein CapC [Pantoea rodasii]
MLSRKIKKFLKSPPLFFKDYLNKKYPTIRNEIDCPEELQDILIKSDLKLNDNLENKLIIDVVFTWVDDSDEKWMDKKNLYAQQIKKPTASYALDKARFTNHNELLYSVKSILKHIPWVNKIYIVTDNQSPKWYNIEKNKKVIIVDHKEIIPEEYLPTFNSHVIEANIHKINNLSEYFIYFNDDVFVARDLPKNHFFESNGLASLYTSQKKLSLMKAKGVLTPTLTASLKSSELINLKTSFLVDSPLVHTYVPLRKSMYNEVWDEFELEIKSFLSNKFRTYNDLNLATFFVPWFSYTKGMASIKRDICYYFNIRSKSARSYYKALKELKIKGQAPHSFCANDFNTENEHPENYIETLTESLENYYQVEK